MQLAQSYLQGQGSPFDGVLEAYGQGQTLRQNRDLLQAQQAEQARKIQAQQQLETLDWDDQNAIAQVVAQFPEYTKGAQDYYASMEAKEQQAMLSDMSKSISALGSNRPDVAVQTMREKAQAYNDAGMTDKAEEYSGMAEWMATDPQAARKALLMNYSIMAGKDAGAAYSSYTDAMTPQRKEVDSGDALYSYDIDPLSGDIGGAEWIVDKSATPDNILDNETSIANTTQTNQVSEANNIRSGQVSENNNIRSNQVSENNNIRSNQQSDANSQRAAYIQEFGIKEKGRQADNQIEYNLQKQELANKEAKLQTFGGKVYMVYKDGTAAPALDAQGQQILDNKTDAAAQTLNRKETQRIEKLNVLIPEIKTLLKDATGSRTGAVWDATASAFGKATEGAKTTAQLKTLSGQMVSMMPRMEGPQSDKDVDMYKEMAGNIGDPTKTRAERLAALATIEKMNNKYAELNKRLSSQGGQQSSGSGNINNDAKRSKLFN